jgi:hypothetical protein
MTKRPLRSLQIFKMVCTPIVLRDGEQYFKIWSLKEHLSKPLQCTLILFEKLRDNDFSFLLSCVFVMSSFYYVEVRSFYASFVYNFYHEVTLNFTKCLFAFIKMSIIVPFCWCGIVHSWTIHAC